MSISTNTVTSLAQSQPPPTRGMESINRYWDQVNGIWAAKILPGELYVSAQGEMVVTVLGSCVAACVRDKSTGVGGMNHFLLPRETEYSLGDDDLLKSRYGNWAMEMLINEVLKRGGRKQTLEVKIFGGANVMNSMTTDIGERNISFVRGYLQAEAIGVCAEDVGGMRPRKVYYNPVTGRCGVKFFDRLNNRTVLDREEVYTQRIAGDSDGSVELF